MARRTVLMVIAIVIIALVGTSALLYSSSRPASSTPCERIKIAAAPLEANGLLYIAQDKGFFTGNGLDVSIVSYDTGLASLDGMLAGDTDLAMAAEFALVRKAFQGENLSVIGNVDKGEYIYLIGRKDRGIGGIADLRGKTIALPRGTISEFFLGRTLSLNGLTMQDVNLVNINRSQSVDVLVNGDVDAIITTQPYVGSIQGRLGDNAVILPVQSKAKVFGVLIGTDDWLARNPELAERLLKSLAQAEDYVVDHPADAGKIIQRRLNYSDEYMETAWQEHQYELTLDQSLIIAMEDEGRWMMANNLTTSQTLPDFRKYVASELLGDVRLEAVKING